MSCRQRQCARCCPQRTERSPDARPLRVAVVTGANRGLGLEVSRQLAHLGYRVVLGSRDLAKGAQAAATLAEAGLDVTPVELDVTEPATLTRLAGRLEAEAGHVDVLVNNAAIHYDVVAAGDCCRSRRCSRGDRDQPHRQRGKPRWPCCNSSGAAGTGGSSTFPVAPGHWKTWVAERPPTRSPRPR